MNPKIVDCQLHQDVKNDIAELASDVKNIYSKLSQFPCMEYRVRMSKIEDEMNIIKKELREINKERYMVRGIVILFTMIGSMIGSLIISLLRH